MSSLRGFLGVVVCFMVSIAPGLAVTEQLVMQVDCNEGGDLQGAVHEAARLAGNLETPGDGPDSDASPPPAPSVVLKIWGQCVANLRITTSNLTLHGQDGATITGDAMPSDAGCPERSLPGVPTCAVIDVANAVDVTIKDIQVLSPGANSSEAGVSAQNATLKIVNGLIASPAPGTFGFVATHSVVEIHNTHVVVPAGVAVRADKSELSIQNSGLEAGAFFTLFNDSGLQFTGGALIGTGAEGFAFGMNSRFTVDGAATGGPIVYVMSDGDIHLANVGNPQANVVAVRSNVTVGPSTSSTTLGAVTLAGASLQLFDDLFIGLLMDDFSRAVVDGAVPLAVAFDLSNVNVDQNGAVDTLVCNTGSDAVCPFGGVVSSACPSCASSPLLPPGEVSFPPGYDAQQRFLEIKQAVDDLMNQTLIQPEHSPVNRRIRLDRSGP